MRQWGATDAAIEAAAAVFRTLPVGLPQIGIFPTGFDEDTDTSDGGVALQMYSAIGAARVEITAAGSFDAGFYCDDEISRDEPIKDAAAAATFFAKASEVAA